MDIKQQLHDLVDGLNLESEITTLKPIILRMNGFEYNLKSKFDILYLILETNQKFYLDTLSFREKKIC